MSNPGASSRRREYDNPPPEETGWLGWVVFAGVMMIILGIFHGMAWFVSLFRSETYVVGSNGLVIGLNYPIWGWIHLILGVVLIIGGIALFRGARWARILAVAVAGVSAVNNLAFLAASPVWNAIMIAVDVLVIYAVTVHGREAEY